VDEKNCYIFLGKGLQAYVGRTQISRVKILAPRAKAAQNGGEKSGCYFFRNGYNGLAFLCNGTDQHDIRVKNVNRCAPLNVNRKNYENIRRRGDFTPKPPFMGCFDGHLCHRPKSTFFVRLTVSAVEAPKVTQISLSEP